LKDRKNERKKTPLMGADQMRRKIKKREKANNKIRCRRKGDGTSEMLVTFYMTTQCDIPKTIHCR
jgi:hypothetical protein